MTREARPLDGLYTASCGFNNMIGDSSPHIRVELWTVVFLSGMDAAAKGFTRVRLRLRR